MTTAILNEVLQDVAAAEHTAAERFEDLARQIHEGRRPKPSEVLDVLRAAEKTRDDLAELVRVLNQRAELRRKIAAARAAETRRVELQEELHRANAELEAAVQRHQLATAPIQNELRRNADTIAAAGGADAQLIHTSSPTLRSRYRWLLERRDAAERELRDARDLLSSRSADVGTPSYRRPAQESYRRAVDATVARGADRVAAAERVVGELSAEIAELERAMRDW